MDSAPNPPTVAPPRRPFPFAMWVIIAGIIGCTIGLGSFTFIYARGYSYLTDDPNACANCHIMNDVFKAWSRGSHKAVATCNDCHTPHTSLVEKYLVKAINGFNHSVAFTSGNFPEPIQITELNHEVALENCIYCHGEMVAAISHEGDAEPTDCIRCHAGVGHGR